MTRISRFLAMALLLVTAVSLITNIVAGFSAIAQSASPPSAPPREWVDPDTGHRVIRLSEDSGGSSFYFHQNGYTANGDKLVITTRGGLSTIDLKTRKVEPIVEGRVSHVVIGKRTRQVFYLKEDTVYATHIDTRETRAIVKLPDVRSGSGLTVNADETLLAGSMIEGGRKFVSSVDRPAGADSYPGKGQMMEERLAARLPMALYTINIKTGEVKTFHHCTDWLNHVQFSPT